MTIIRTLLSAFALLLAAATLSAELIPSARLFNWQAGVNIGVPGGIPTNRTTTINVTSAPYNADKTGANDASSAINSAISAAGAGTIIYLPAGTYRLNAGINLRNRSDITLRGAGQNQTILDARAASGSGIYVGADTQWPDNYNSGGANITAGLNQGSTSITVSDASLFAVGSVAILTEANDGSLPVVDVAGNPRARGQLSRVTAKSGSNLTIAPALHWTLGSSRSPKAHPLLGKVSNVGVEDLTLELANSTLPFGIWLQQADRCWIKNVKISHQSNYGIYMLYAFESEVRHSEIRDRKAGGTNGAGILLERSTSSLMEDNILVGIFPHLEVNFMSTGNVFAYNLCEDSSIYGMVGCSIDSNHGAHNSFNLYEGNIAPNVQSDGFFGSTSDDTIFRNWLHGTSPTAANRQPILLQRFTRNYSIVGNILGKTGQTYPGIYSFGLPNMGNGSSTGTVQLSQGIKWADWGTSAGASGFQELDLDVQATTVLKANYSSVAGGIPSSEALGSDTLPNSLFRSVKPAWFGNLAWPAFNPFSPNQSIQAIPAGYRYVNGADPSGGTAPATLPPTNAKVIISIP
jgi:hypothetical protein